MLSLVCQIIVVTKGSCDQKKVCPFESSVEQVTIKTTCAPYHVWKIDKLNPRWLTTPDIACCQCNYG